MHHLQASSLRLGGFTHPAFPFLVTFPQELCRPFFHHVAFGRACFPWMVLRNVAGNSGGKPTGERLRLPDRQHQPPPP